MSNTLKTTLVIVAVAAILMAMYFLFFYKKQTPDATKLGTIDCTKYWSLNSIDKQWCKSKGLAPAPINVATNVAPLTGPGSVNYSEAG